MISRRSTIATICASALAAALSGCGATVDVPEAPPGATRAPLALEATGRIALVAEALGEVPLLPEQRAEVEKLAKEADARHAALSQIKQKAADLLAAQVEAGKLDRAALQPAIDSYSDEWARARVADRTAIERLHAVLDAGQRSTLVDELTERLENRKKGSRLERMMELATDLQLSEDQIEQLRNVMHSQRKERGRGDHAKKGEWRGKREQMLESFAEDDFSLAGMPTFDDLRAKAGRKAERMVGKVEAAMPILTAEQRKLAAAKIRAHAADVIQ